MESFGFHAFFIFLFLTFFIKKVFFYIFPKNPRASDFGELGVGGKVSTVCGTHLKLFDEGRYGEYIRAHCGHLKLSINLLVLFKKTGMKGARPFLPSAQDIFFPSQSRVWILSSTRFIPLHKNFTRQIKGNTDG